MVESLRVLLSIIHAFVRGVTAISDDVEVYQKRAARLFHAESMGVDPDSMNEFSLNRKCVPAYLYKYHAVDDYTVDALINSYVYIAPAHLMDDQFELALNMIEGIRDIEGLHRFDDKYIQYLCDTLENRSPEFRRDIGKMRKDLKGDLSVWNTDVYLKTIVAQDPEFKEISDWIESLSRGEEFKQYTGKFFDELQQVKSKFGFYSMTEDKYNQVMWSMYGSDYRGILIEYDMSTAEDSFLKNLIKVRYPDSRDADPLKLFVDMLVSTLTDRMDQGNYQLQLLEWILKVIATKNTEWSFQKEWRTSQSRPKRSVLQEFQLSIWERISVTLTERGYLL